MPNLVTECIEVCMRRAHIVCRAMRCPACCAQQYVVQGKSPTVHEALSMPSHLTSGMLSKISAHMLCSSGARDSWTGPQAMLRARPDAMSPAKCCGRVLARWQCTARAANAGQCAAAIPDKRLHGMNMQSIIKSLKHDGPTDSATMPVLP